MTVDVAPAFTVLAQLSTDEKIIYARLRKQLSQVAPKNLRNEKYYEGSQKVRHLDIAVPPTLADLQVVCGWAGTAIDVIEERLYWDNWTSTGDLMGLDEIYNQNNLRIESSKISVDSLLAGVAFTTVGKGDPAEHEPDILVTGESPSDCTILWDYRARRGIAALSRTVNAFGIVTMETLYLLNETITLERIDQRMVVTDRDEHGFNRIPVSPIVNRSRASRIEGRSELTRAVRYYTDGTVRTLLGMEINREFYTAPQRWMMGADMSAFTDKEGNQVSAWEAVMGHMLAMPRQFDEDSQEWSDLPKVGQFTAAPPTPYIEQVRAYSMLFAAEVGIPASYLGYATDNPASADAIKAGEVRLIKRTENRQDGQTPGWMSTAYNILLWRDGKVNIKELAKAACKWRAAGTPTRQAEAMEASQLVDSGILPPDSSVTYDRIGLTAQEQRQLVADARRKRSGDLVTGLSEAAAAARANADVIDLNERRRGNPS